MIAGLWVETCQNVEFSKIDITITKINFEIDKRLILRDLDRLLWSNTRNLKFGV